MLETAVHARLPLITTRTDDLLNAVDVLAALIEEPVQPFSSYNSKLKDRVYVSFGFPDKDDAGGLYRSMVMADSTLVIINPDDPVPEAFDAGVLPIPKALVKKHLQQCGADNEEVMRCMTGLTIKQVVELVRLTQASFGDVLPRHLMKVRSRLMAQTPGLIQVDTEYDLYLPDPALEKWGSRNAVYFLDPKDARLVPRGLLLNGPPGVGKTMAAKYVSRNLGVPLYRLDLSASLGRYVGESEANLSRLLSVVDQEEPCVLLIDEVEKVFQAKEDSGVTSRLLGQLLWWLQEHKSRVLTVMTTNDKEALPPELYRSGRIDAVVEVARPTKDEALALSREVMKSFGLDGAAKIKTVGEAVKLAYVETTSHADVVALVRETIKERLWL